MGGDAAVEPADGAVHGFTHAKSIRGGGDDDVVELHYYVGADGVLEGDGVFGSKEPEIIRDEICSSPTQRVFEKGRNN